MKSSASSSSSPVETPGRTWSRSSAIVSATMRPAFAIISISAVDLRMIISSRYPRAYASRAVTTPPSPARPPAGSRRTPRSRADRRGCRRGFRPAGSARRAASSPDGRARSASRSPRACRRSGPPRRRASRSRSIATSSGTWSSSTTDSGRSISASIESSASAWAIVRGKPSRMNPSAASGDWRRSRISSIIRSSGHEVAALEDRLDAAGRARCPPRSPRGACPRSRSARGRTPRRAASPAFPFPDPWTPRSRTIERHYFRKPS